MTIGVLWRFDEALEAIAEPALAVRQTAHPAIPRPPTATDSQAPIGDDTLANILLLPSDFQQTLTLYTLLADAKRETLERLLDEAGHLQPRREVRAAKSVIYSRYAELDPNAAVERIIAGRHVGAKPSPARASFFGFGLSTTAAWRCAAPKLCRSSIDASPAGAILAVSEDALPGQRDEIAATFGLRGQLEQMQADEAMRDSPAIAWRQAIAAPPSRHRMAVLNRIASGWGERDPQQALAAIAELKQVDLRRSIRYQLMAGWALRDRRAARAWVDALPPSEERTGMTRAFASVLVQEAPQEALDFMLTLAPSERRATAHWVFSAWAERDPRAAADAVATLDDAAIVESSARAVLEKWAHADPYAAFEWASRQDTLPQDGSLYIGPLLGIAAYEPVEALDFALELANGSSEAVAIVLKVWARDDPLAAGGLAAAGGSAGRFLRCCHDRAALR